MTTPLARSPGLGRRLRRRLTVAAVVTFAGLLPVAAGSSTGAPDPYRARPAPNPPPSLVWTACDGPIECAQLQVPLTYRDPNDRVLLLALRRHSADDPAHRIGSLIINPGGPGEAGTQLLRRDLGVLTPTVRARFDVVEMDPRGIGASGGFHCNPPTAGPVDPVPSSPASESALTLATRAYAGACARAAGTILANMGTEDVARDLEQLRASLGEPKLTFLGLSYGSLLGATYADHFPDHVRAMVLDGVIDPSLPTFELSMQQASGMQTQLDAFFTWCTQSGCAWRPGASLPDAFDQLAQQLRDRPIPGDTGTVGVAELYAATLSRMYSPARWTSLASALAAAERGDGHPLGGLAREYFGQAPNGTINPDATVAVNCLDHPVTRRIDRYHALAIQARARARHFGPYLAWGGSVCAAWSALPTRTPHEVHATGAPPIVVVGTTDDPATPYRWALSLSTQLDSGVLLTRRGTGHVAYLASACVRNRLDAYFVDILPPDPAVPCAG